MRHQRLLVLPLFDEHHLGGIGDAFVQVIGDAAVLLAGLLDAGRRRRNEFGARLGFHHQRGNDVDHDKLLPASFGTAGSGFRT